MGTAKYLSPEQVEGRPLDARSDVYALGVVLYESLCGRAPFDAEHATATAVARLHGDPPSPRSVRGDVPPALEAIVVRAMARRLDDRFSTAAALRSALESVDLRADVTASTAAIAAPAGDQTTVHRPDATAAYRPTATTGDDAPAPAPVRRAPARRPVRRGDRSWVALGLLLVVVAATLGLVGALLGRTEPGQDLFDRVRGRGGGAVLDVVAVADYDPEGRGGEHAEEVPLLDDDDPGTAWTTETYDTELTDQKRGVGVVLTLAAVSEVTEVQVETATAGWAAEVYVADGTPATLEGWGAAVGSDDGLTGDTTFDLSDARGSAVLLWLTDVGESNQAELAEVTVRGSVS